MTGKPVWAIEERPVPSATVPGERASRTQPFPAKPPAFDRQGITEDDLIDFTPELRAEALAIARTYVLGPMFTPGSLPKLGPDGKQGTIQIPGTVGGADWTGAAFDPETARLYVPSMTGPIAQNMMPGNPESSNLRYRVSNNTRYTRVVGPRGLPIVKPPYGRVTALDLNRGEKVWTVPNGDGPRNHPAIARLKLGPLGNASRSGLIATKTLLFATVSDQITVPRLPVSAGISSARSTRRRASCCGRPLSRRERPAHR